MLGPAKVCPLDHHVAIERAQDLGAEDSPSSEVALDSVEADVLEAEYRFECLPSLSSLFRSKEREFQDQRVEMICLDDVRFFVRC